MLRLFTFRKRLKIFITVHLGICAFAWHVDIRGQLFGVEPLLPSERDSRH